MTAARPVPGVDTAVLADWSRRAHPELAGEHLDVRLLAGGATPPIG